MKRIKNHRGIKSKLLPVSIKLHAYSISDGVMGRIQLNKTEIFILQAKCNSGKSRLPH